MTEQLLDLAQACDLLEVSPATLRRHLRRHRVAPALVGRGPGGKHLYRVGDIEGLREQMNGHAYALSEHEHAEPTQVITQDHALSSHDHALLSQAIASLAARAEAADQRADRAEAARDALLTRALVAELELARVRPLTPLPDPPAGNRRRWWGG